MKVRFIKETSLHPKCKPTKINQVMDLKSNVAEKLWRNGSIEILDPHNFEVKKEEKKTTKKLEKKENKEKNNPLNN
tara:strand:- start:539 stop:766 length:228 start_codon:yes stop_codon:yes gene_type:complete